MIKVVLADDLVSETSHSFTTSIDWSKNYEDGSQIGVTVEPFYTLLDNPFALEPMTDSAGNDTKEQVKVNEDQATVMGVNLEFKYAPNEQFIFQAGATVQEGKFSKEIEIGESETGETINSDKFLRSPSVYGNFVATYAPTKKMQHNLSSIITGPMDIAHALENDKARLETSDSFLELNWKSSYNFDLDDHKHLQLQVNGGVQNILNSYQDDFDKGAGRDAAYIYGPSRPRTIFIGFKIGNL